jgi:hypothetical protein
MSTNRSITRSTRRSATRSTMRRVPRPARETGQTTAEYALVILGSAAIATLLLTWASKSGGITQLFDMVVGRLLPG